MQLPPIVEKMHELNRWLLQKVGKFPRDQQFLLGQRLAGKGLDIQEKLVAAAILKNSDEKSAALRAIDIELEQLRYLIRLAGEGKCMNQTSWYFCSRNVLEIGKMLGGWIKTM
jgi:hypothetical protein